MKDTENRDMDDGMRSFSDPLPPFIPPQNVQLQYDEDERKFESPNPVLVDETAHFVDTANLRKSLAMAIPQGGLKPGRLASHEDLKQNFRGDRFGWRSPLTHFFDFDQFFPGRGSKLVAITSSAYAEAMAAAGERYKSVGRDENGLGVRDQE